MKNFLEEQVKKDNISQYLKEQSALIITDGPSKNPSGRHVVNNVIRGSMSASSKDEYIKKIFLIEEHQTKKAKSPDNMISFSNKDCGEVNPRHVDALVVKLDIVD